MTTVATELGLQSTYNRPYSPSLLIAIPRKKIALDTVGHDLWRCYEVSWLDLNNKPVLTTLVLSYPSSSEFIVESKSLKIYLGSFNFMQFASSSELLQTVTHDLKNAIGCDINAYFDDVMSRGVLPGTCIDDNMSIPDYNSGLMVLDNTVTETLHSNLFRSLCPVTAQPDWASILIIYTGLQISRESLLSYILSFREHQSFHEECVETIYAEIIKQCAPANLFVQGFFTRRGGIDINPCRSSHVGYSLANLYLPRQ